MAQDGLLPAFFSKVNETGNLWNGTLVAGIAMTVIASLVPFEHLNDVISCGILTVLSLTDSSVVLLWHEAPAESSDLAHYLMTTFHAACLATCVLLMHYGDSNLGKWAILISGTVTLTLPVVITQWCPRTLVFGGQRHHYHEEQIIREAGYFRTPLVPFLPCLAIFVNYYLFVQLDWTGPAGLFACLGASSIYYFFGATHQRVDEKEELESSACTGENVSLINT
jgi:amino acid transporter